MTKLLNTAHKAIEHASRVANPNHGIHAIDFDNVVFNEQFIINDNGLVIRLTVKYFYNNQVFEGQADYTNSDD